MSKPVKMVDKKGGTEISVPAVNVELMQRRGWKLSKEPAKKTRSKTKRK